jgi:diguanylate cyclase (GGDEF)-like protein
LRPSTCAFLSIQMKAKLPLIRTMQLGFGAVVAVLLIVSAIAYRGLIASSESAHWAQHTHEVLEHLAKLRLAMENLESGYREFALSGDDDLPQSSRTKISLLAEQLSALRALTVDNPAQQRRLVIITDLEERIVQGGDTIVRLRQAGGTKSAVDLIRKAQNDAMPDDFRSVALGMEDEEQRLLLERNANEEHNYRQSKLALVFGSVLALLIAGVSGWMVPRDHTERLEAQDNLRRLNRLYAMVSSINALGVRVRDRDDLFKSACRIAVEHGKFLMAWIGIVDRNEMIPMASAGLDENAMAALRKLFHTHEGALQGQTLVARTIREKATSVSNYAQNDDRLVFGKMYVELGVRSIAVLPLIVSNGAIGVFVLYTDKPEFFDAAGLPLLNELAGNVAASIDHIEKRERLDRFAYYDALTGLANRSLFLDRVAQHILSAASGGHKLAVFLIDLERFKKFNDSLGRPAGDELLKQVADWLGQNAGASSALARVGADHFAVVLPEVTYEADAIRLLEKMIAALLNQPFRVNDAVYRIAAKVGGALFPDDGVDAETLFKNAEAALKKAKMSGDRYLFFAQKMTETVAGSLGIENRLRHALERQEFVLHYQPKVNLVSGELTGAEALIRWNDPQTGLVPPARFIPILEETGLIREVGRWALHKAIEDYQRWRSAGLPAVRIAVNVSPLQLRDRRFVAEVEEAISIAAGAAAGLELEITESLIMEDVDNSIVSLLALRALGVTIAIDDFGTGFSSLSYLSKLPVDTLKIDRSFVVDMVSGMGGVTLVSVIINLAHALKLNVVAEGVESEEQLRQLRLLHCDEIQGYLYGKPAPVEIFEKRYLARSAGLAPEARRLQEV